MFLSQVSPVRSPEPAREIRLQEVDGGPHVGSAGSGPAGRERWDHKAVAAEASANPTASSGAGREQPEP